jgi:DNA ligase-associated metallophosphoesterase
VQLAGDEFILSHRRVAYCPGRRALLVADLHLGKADAMRWRGAPVPDAVTVGLMSEPLARLTGAIRAFSPTRLLILGDLIHDPAGMNEHLIDAIATWREGADVRGLDIDLIRGNHDRRVEPFVDAWRMRLHASCLDWPPFTFVHDPTEWRPSPERFVWGGHVHPAIAIGAPGVGRVKVPCFHLSRGRAILPAFSRFTGGVPANPESGDRLIACVGEEVIEIPAPGAGAREGSASGTL